MSRIHSEVVPFSELIRSSSIIVVAKSDEPFRTQKQRRIKKGRPYSWVVYRFKVSEVVRSPGGLMKPDSIIEVSTFDDVEFDDHRDYYEKGLDKSRTVRHYRPASGPIDFEREAKTNGVILFLVPASEKNNTFSFTKKGGFESVAQLPRIRDLVRSSAWKTDGTSRHRYASDGNRGATCVDG